MRFAKRTWKDTNLLNRLLAGGISEPVDQPAGYEGVAVMKPWGYEFQVFDNKKTCLWLACLNPGQAVSMHCHQRKQAAFLPLTSGIRLCLLEHCEDLDQLIIVESGVFHSQENPTMHDCFFFEYEWPSEKADLVRYQDRYGRESLGYEGKSQMVPLCNLQMPETIRRTVEWVVT